jgi:hypothetical protein
VKKLILALAIVSATAAPAMADDPDYPPTSPPCSVDCDTASTGFDITDGGVPIGVGFLVIGTVALAIAGRRVRR